MPSILGSTGVINEHKLLATRYEWEGGGRGGGGGKGWQLARLSVLGAVQCLTDTWMQLGATAEVAKVSEAAYNVWKTDFTFSKESRVDSEVIRNQADLNETVVIQWCDLIHPKRLPWSSEGRDLESLDQLKSKSTLTFVCIQQA